VFSLSPGAAVSSSFEAQIGQQHYSAIKMCEMMKTGRVKDWLYGK
jgi:hypothetical protein